MIRHLACIMDGNRRWAQRRFLLPWYGHKEGVHAVKRVMQFCLDNTIAYLSLYTFSVENLNRPEDEKFNLFSYLQSQAAESADYFLAQQIRVRFIGERTLFPASFVPICQMLEEKTAHCTQLQVQFLFCYGGRQEIISSVKEVAKQVQAGLLDVEQITDQTLESYLWTKGVPAPDLIVRTGGFKRLSNFLLYQAAYSELYFLDCLWPDISAVQLQEAVDYFDSCKRNFGV